MTSEILKVADIAIDEVVAVVGRYGLKLVVQGDDQPIKGSFWGDTEAGIVKKTVHVRRDTPVHSLLHETCHIICMTSARRRLLDRDAGGDDLEEAAVCYLQIILAEDIGGVERARMMRDMDTWGYSFRRGNTRDWFEHDAEDALQFLINQRLLTEKGELTYRLRS